MFETGYVVHAETICVYSHSPKYKLWADHSSICVPLNCGGQLNKMADGLN